MPEAQRIRRSFGKNTITPQKKIPKNPKKLCKLSKLPKVGNHGENFFFLQMGYQVEKWICEGVFEKSATNSSRFRPDSVMYVKT